MRVECAKEASGGEEECVCEEKKKNVWPSFFLQASPVFFEDKKTMK
jgi:hypothetical protein